MLMAILGLVLLGLALVACVMIGGRWLRGVARDSSMARRRTRAHREPTAPGGARADSAQTGEAGETTVAQRKSDDTDRG